MALAAGDAEAHLVLGQSRMEVDPHDARVGAGDLVRLLTIAAASGVGRHAKREAGVGHQLDGLHVVAAAVTKVELDDGRL